MREKDLQSEERFLQRYAKLNAQQKQAVDTIYGAVMVIAGPGTGKTEVLAMRIANLLRSDAQVQPHEILCLTYTDEAAHSMRKRLVQIAGQAAHRVNIYTFHGFCNSVIQQYPDSFSRREMQPLDDLEKTELLHEILEQLPSGNPLRRLSGDIYLDTDKLHRLFDYMKREHIGSANLSKAIDDYLADLPNRPEYVYKINTKNGKKGELRQNLIDEATTTIERTRAAALLYDEYQQRMRARARYDFNDMIIWVLEAFAREPWLLQTYQERFQYILADEYQDTNGAQNELLNMLTSYWDDPNIFVVGDDDQSIYEFQGARIRNIIDFYERYKEHISIIVLPQNYRSSQAIIDKAMATIANNKQRLINQLHELQLNKDIVAAHDRFKDGKDTVTPSVKIYPNIVQEEMGVVQEIVELKNKGVPLSEIAVIYAQHRQADNIIKLLDQKEIAYSIKKEVNVLELHQTQIVLSVLQYIDRERKRKFDGEDLLFELMHAPYFEIDPNDIALLALYMQQKRGAEALKWRLALSNPLMIEALQLKSAKAMHRLGRCLDNWEAQQMAMPLPLLVEKILHEGGIIAHLVKTADHVWNLQAMYSFFEFVKDSFARNQRLNTASFLHIIDKMLSQNIALKLNKVIQNELGVQFYTAHSAKGNEFEHVYLIGCTENFWEKKKGGNNNYTLPDTLTETKTDDSDNTYKQEVARRLFYVALTRAKKHLTISYAEKNNSGTSLFPSSFVGEISTEEERERIYAGTDAIEDHLALSLAPAPEKRIRIANGVQIDKMLQQLTMSASTLNKFLKCRLAFYYENILKVPTQKSDALGFGSAIHYALEKMYVHLKMHGSFPDKDFVLAAFKSELYRESSSFTAIQFERRMEQGYDLLDKFYERTIIKPVNTNIEVEMKIPRYLLDSVPVTGKIDRMEFEQNECTVIDYKTGDPESSYAKNNLNYPNDKNPNGGDYWRQMVFYKLLIEGYAERSWQVSVGQFEYLQPAKDGTPKIHTVQILEKDLDIVRTQLKESYTSIMNHEFDRGCGEENCHWCNFAKRYELIRDADEPEMDED